MSRIGRRVLVRGLAGAPAAVAGLARPHVARAAEFSLKYGNNLPVTHPLNIRAQEFADQIAKESGGRVEVKIFPNNQLGGDTDMLSGRMWSGLPDDLRKIVADAINGAGLRQRADIKALNDRVQADLQAKGLQFVSPAPDSFRAKLREAGFYAEWKGKFGDEAWGLLERAVGTLA